MSGFSWKQDGNDIPAFWAIFFIILLCAVYIGASYGYGVSGHDEQIPIIKKMMNSSYLTNDWVVNQSSGFSVREYFTLIMADAASFTGLPVAYFIIQAASALAIAFAVYLISFELFRKRLTSVLSVFLVFFGAQASLGGDWIIMFFLVPSNIANAFALFSIYLYLKNRRCLAFLLLGVATLFQLLVGIIVAAILLLHMLLGVRKTGIMPLLKPASCYLAIAIFNIIPSLFFLGMGRLTAAEIVRILGYVRCPWHYMPFQFPLMDYVMFFSLAALFFLSARKFRPEKHKFAMALLCVVVLMCIAGTVFVEIIPVSTILKLQLFRSTTFLSIFFYIYAAEYMRRAFYAGGSIGAKLLITLIVILFSVSYTLVVVVALIFVYEGIMKSRFKGAMERLRRPNVINVAVLLLIAAAVIAFLSSTTVQKQALSLFDSFYIKAAGMAVIAAILVMLALRERFEFLKGRVSWYLIAVIVLAVASAATFQAAVLNAQAWGSDYQKTGAYDWIRTNTPEDAIFIIPPGVDDFRLGAERAIVADFRAFPWDDTIKQWMERINDLTNGVEFKPGGDRFAEVAGGFATLGEGDFKRIAEKYGANYLFVERGTGKSGLDFEAVYENGNYIVYSIKA